jgi:signal transduction histidine kinase
MRSIITLFALLAILSSCNTDLPEDASCKDTPLSPADSAAVNQLNASTKNREFLHPDSAIYIGLLKRNIAQRAGNKKMVMDYYVEVSEIHLNYRQDMKQSKLYADSALWFAEQPGNECLKYEAYNCLGNYFLDVNDSLASYYLLKSLELQPTPIDSITFLNDHILLAIIAHNQKNYDAASDFFEPVIRHLENQPPSTFQIVAFSDGFDFANKSTPEGQARARKYLFKAKQVLESLHDTSTAATVYSNLARYYAEAEKYHLSYKPDSVLFFAEKAIAYSGPQPFNDRALSFISAAAIYLDRGNATRARQVMDRLDALADTIVFEKKQVEADYYYVRYRLLKQERDIAGALAALEKKEKVEEELNKNEKDEQLLNHQKELKRLAAEKTIAAKNSLAEKRRLQVIGLSVFSALLLILIAVSYLYWRNKRMLERERLLEAQRQKEFESQKKLFEERSRIADEMHDDLGTTLTSAIMAVELIKRQPGNSTHIDMISRSAHQLSDQISEIIRNMNIKNDKLESLIDYIIRRAADFLKDANIGFTWNEDLKEQDVPVNGHIRRAIHLCVKELINNIVKHAEATKVVLNFAYEQGRLTIDIQDDGLGFSGAKSSSAGTGNGLLNIKRRVEDLEGEILWKEGNPGTHVRISLPL